MAIVKEHPEKKYIWIKTLNYPNIAEQSEHILLEDVAEACFVFVGGALSKSTGNVLNVDGGIAMAFVR